jgi:hypothetical protein
MSGRRWWFHRSLHCFPILPSSEPLCSMPLSVRAIELQLPSPCCVTNLSRQRSSVSRTSTNGCLHWGQLTENMLSMNNASFMPTPHIRTLPLSTQFQIRSLLFDKAPAAPLKRCRALGHKCLLRHEERAHATSEPVGSPILGGGVSSSHISGLPDQSSVFLCRPSSFDFCYRITAPALIPRRCSSRGHSCNGLDCP